MGGNVSGKRESLSDVWDIIRWSHICAFGVQDGGRDAVVAEKVFEEIVVRNFPNTDENFNPKDLIN